MQARRDDRQLARNVLNGDRNSLRTLFDRHYGPVYRYCLRQVPQADAEEIATETLRQAIRRIETYRGEAALTTWDQSRGQEPAERAFQAHQPNIRP